MTSDAGQSLLVGRLSPDRELARHAGFALFVLVHLERRGLLPRQLTAGQRDASRWLPLLPDAVRMVNGQNPHLLADFAAEERIDALSGLDPGAAAELVGWLEGQRLEQEEPQIAYELGMLALGVELPSILVRGLREAPISPHTDTVELPDGSGYPTIFLSTLHPQWRAAERATLCVEGTDATQLAGWAMLLLSGQLAPPPNSIRRVVAADRTALHEREYDLALAYNVAPWLTKAGPAALAGAIRAKQIVLL